MKSTKLFQFFICIFLFHFIYISAQNDCISRKKDYTSFQSALKLKFIKYRANVKTTEKEYFIKETYHRGKGKLEVDFLKDGSKKIYIFDFDKNQMYEQIVDLDICKSSKIIDISQNPRHSLGIFDIRNDDESLIGPTVLINRLINLKNPKYVSRNERGIDALECEFKTESNQMYYLTVMNKFESRFEPILKVRFENKIRRFLNFVMDTLESNYFYLRTLDDNEDLNFEHDELHNNDFWYIPDYCVENQNETAKPPYQKELRLPKQYMFTMQTIKNEQQTDRQIESLILFADTNHKLISLKNSQSRSNAKVILDLKNRIEYELNSESCNKNFNGQYRNLKQFKDLIEIMNRIKKIKVTNYIGQRNCRELVCETFSFYSSVDSLDDIIKEEESDEDAFQNTKDKVNQKSNLKVDSRLLYTIYLYYDSSTNYHHLIQFKKQLFSDEEEPKLINTVVFEIYDFKNKEQNYENVLDLTDCSYEDEHQIEIRLTGLTKANLDDKEKNRLEEETISKIKEISGLVYYNIRKIETIVGQNSLTVSLKLIQPINDLFYYETFNQYSIPLVNLKEKLTKKTIEECASLAKKSGWLGFQHCPNEICYSIKATEQFELTDVQNDEYEAQCITKRQIQNFKFNYLTIPESIKRIEKSIKESNFKLDNGLIFKSLEDLHEINQIDKENQFKLIQDEKCFNDQKLKDALKCKLKSRLLDCKLTCETTNCNMFSVRRIEQDQWNCCFVEQTFTEFKEQSKVDDRWIDDKECSIYELSYLNKFSRSTGKTIDSKAFKSFLKVSPENCAVECLKQNKNDQSNCLSFSYCSDKTKDEYYCELRIHNRYNLGESSKLVNSKDCTLYSANFLIDYHKIDFNKLVNFTYNEDYNLQECAKQCKHKDKCSKFNFCNHKGNQICLLETNETTIIDHPTDLICTSYLRNEHLILDDLIVKPNKPNKSNKQTYSIYVYIGFFLLGLKIGPAFVLARKIALCRVKRKFCGRLYVKFKQEEDAISFGQISQTNEEEQSSKKNSSQNEDKIKIEESNEKATETDEGINYEHSF